MATITATKVALLPCIIGNLHFDQHQHVNDYRINDFSARQQICRARYYAIARLSATRMDQSKNG